MSEPEPCGKVHWQSLFEASKKVQFGPAKFICCRRRGKCRQPVHNHPSYHYYTYTMPATRSKRGKRSKAAAAPPVSVPENAPADSEKEAASEMILEEQNAPAESEKEATIKLTMEERKAKLDELRKKMVCLLFLPYLRIQFKFRM